jgi:hypothetical protein
MGADSGIGADSGCPGTDGSSGRDGLVRPAPPVFVNEFPVEPVTGPADILPPAAVRSLDTRAAANPISTTS